MIAETCRAVLIMAYWASWAVIQYSWTFLMFSITHRWLMCMAWLMLGIVIGRRHSNHECHKYLEKEFRPHGH